MVTTFVNTILLLQPDAKENNTSRENNGKGQVPARAMGDGCFDAKFAKKQLQGVLWSRGEVCSEDSGALQFR